MKSSLISRILTIVTLVFVAWSFEPAWASPDTCCDEDGGCCETQMVPGSCAHCFAVSVPHHKIFGGDVRRHPALSQAHDSHGLINPNDIWRPPAV